MSFGALDAGVPHLSGGFYHALVLLTWSFACIAIARVLMLEAGEIDWIKAEGDYIRVQLGTRSELIRSTMKSIESLLPPASFRRIHRSAIVNIDSIREIVALPNRECAVVLRNGTSLKASRSYAGTLAALHKRPNAAGQMNEA